MIIFIHFYPEPRVKQKEICLRRERKTIEEDVMVRGMKNCLNEDEEKV